MISHSVATSSRGLGLKQKQICYCDFSMFEDHQDFEKIVNCQCLSSLENSHHVDYSSRIDHPAKKKKHGKLKHNYYNFKESFHSHVEHSNWYYINVFYGLFNIRTQFNNIKLSFFVSHLKRILKFLVRISWSYCALAVMNSFFFVISCVRILSILYGKFYGTLCFLRLCFIHWDTHCCCGDVNGSSSGPTKVGYTRMV